MSRAKVQAFIRDEAGNKLGGTGYEVRFYQAGTNTLQTLYANGSSGSTIPNPHYPNAGVQTALTVQTLTTDTTITVQSASGYQQGDFISLDDGTNRVILCVLSIAAQVITLDAAVGFVFAINNTRVNGRESLGHVAAYCDQASDIEMTAKNLATGIEGPRELFLIKPPGTGTLGYAAVTADQGTITTEVDLTSLSVTVNVGTGRRIKITVYGSTYSSVADDVAEIRIKESTTQLQAADRICRPSGSGSEIQAVVVLTPSAGSHTYKATALRASGTGNVTWHAGATLPAFILVEDIGT